MKRNIIFHGRNTTSTMIRKRKKFHNGLQACNVLYIYYFFGLFELTLCITKTLSIQFIAAYVNWFTSLLITLCYRMREKLAMVVVNLVAMHQNYLKKYLHSSTFNDRWHIRNTVFETQFINKTLYPFLLHKMTTIFISKCTNVYCSYKILI